jgi:hypothetical protein
MENLRAVADYVIRHHYAELGEPSSEVYLRWFEEICRRTAVMISHWMTVGFVHGVMNTDNMSILALPSTTALTAGSNLTIRTGRPTPPTSADAATRSGSSRASRCGT